MVHCSNAAKPTTRSIGLERNSALSILKTRSVPWPWRGFTSSRLVWQKGEELPLPSKTPLAQVLSAFIAHIPCSQDKEHRQKRAVLSAGRLRTHLPELDVPLKTGTRKRKSMRKPASGYIEAGFFEGITTAQIVAFILARMQAATCPEDLQSLPGYPFRSLQLGMSQYGVRMPNDVNPAQKVERYREQA